MMRHYDYRCPVCGSVEERRAWKEVTPCCRQCFAPMRQLPHYHTLRLVVPSPFHTDLRQVLGTPDEVKAMVRRGQIIPAGPGSRWV